MKRILAGALLALALGAANAQNVIILGQSVPLTGANKDLGIDIRDGALAYFRKVNEAGGVNGRKIEMQTMDDGNVVQRAGENTQKLIEEKGVFALFGYASATLSRPALPHVEKHRIPFLSPFTGADPMRVYHRYVFKDRAKPDIDGGMKAVLEGNPEVIIFTTLYKATADSIKAVRKLGSHAFVATNSFPGANQLAKELGKEGAGVIVATVVPPYARMSLPVVNEYRAAMEKYMDRKDFSFTSIESFVAAKATVEALRRAGPKLTREGFMQALDNLSSYDTGGYTIGFTPKDHNGSSFVELTIIGKDGGFKF